MADAARDAELILEAAAIAQVAPGARVFNRQRPAAAAPGRGVKVAHAAMVVGDAVRSLLRVQTSLRSGAAACVTSPAAARGGASPSSSSRGVARRRGPLAAEEEERCVEERGDEEDSKPEGGGVAAGGGRGAGAVW